MSDVRQFGEFPPMLEKMQKAIRSHPWWKKRIDGTPLDNDLAARCAEIAAAELSNAKGAAGSEIAALRTKLAEVEREREGAREACGRYRKNEEGLTYQLSKAHDENKALRAERDNACADLERLRVAAQMALDELHGYADAGCSNKADHICEALRAALTQQPAEQRGSSLMLPDLWTVIDGEGTRVSSIEGAEGNAEHYLQIIEGSFGSIHGPYRVVKIPAHMVTIARNEPTEKEGA